MVRAVRYLKCLVSAGKCRANTAEALACKALDRMSELQALVEKLKGAVGDVHACVAEIFNAELILFRSFITAVLSDSESTVSKAICDICDCFPVEASSDAADPTAGGSAYQAQVSFVA